MERHFQKGFVGYEIDAKGTFALKYLPSRFDIIGVPQMNISIYEVTKHYAYAECQATFTKEFDFRRHADVSTRGVTKVVCRGERIQPPKTAMKKRFIATRRMRERPWAGSNTRPNGGVCIFIIKCVTTVWKEELQHIQWMFFFSEINIVFQLHGCPEYLSGRRKEVLAFEIKQREAGEVWQERCSLHGPWKEGRRLSTRVSNWTSVGSIISKKDHCIRKRKRKPFHAMPSFSISRRCWTRANVSRQRRICCSKASTCRCLFRLQTLWTECQSTSVL